MKQKVILFLILLCAVGAIFSCSHKDDFVPEEEIIFPEYLKFRQTSDYIAVFGDIQYYTSYSALDFFRFSLNWVSKASRQIKIRGVIHTGDITQSNDKDYEWPHFDKAMNGFLDSIPFISAIGDHDYHWSGTFIEDRNNTHFSEHVSFPLVTSRIESYFERGRMENIVVRNEIHGQRYDILVLEFGPRKEVLQWANDWVQSHPDVKYILVNHEYLEKGGGRRTSGLKCVSRLKNTTYITPDELWEGLIKCNDNIAFVLCGHVGGMYAVTMEENDFGREVAQIQHNIQSEPYRYDNWLMLCEFPVDEDYAHVGIYNTKAGMWFENKEVLFEFKYRY